MNISKKLALTALLAASLVTGAAYAAEPGLYLGGSYGQTNVDQDASDFGYKDDNRKFDDDASAWKFFVGYNWSVLSWLNVGLEGGYKNFGQLRTNTAIPGEKLRADPTGWDGFVVGTIPIGPVDVFAKVGGIALNRDVNYLGQQDDEDDNQLAYGVGVAYNFGHLAFRVEAEGFDDNEVDDFYMVSAGFTYHFRSPKPAVVAAPVVAAAACLDGDDDGVCDGVDQCPTTPAGATVDSMGCTCHYSMNLEFAFDSDELTINDMVDLDALVPVLTNPKVSFIGGKIDGYTDEIGTEAYNLDLSKRRAESVYKYLESKGVNMSGRFTTTGYGKSDPVASNATEEGRAKNRRVVLRRTDCK